MEVGCGEGILARELLAMADRVTAIDRDGPSIDLARQDRPDDPVTYVRGDVFTYPFEPASFDLVASVATLHHMDTEAGLVRMRELLRPGGVLVVVGLARPRYPRDLPMDGLGFLYTRLLHLRRTSWAQTAPIVWPPPDTFRQTRATTTRVLPGVRYQRLVLRRYALTWTKPRAQMA